MKIKLAVYFLILAAVWLLGSAPWFSVLVYYLNGIMQPQYVWPWTFPEIPIFSASKLMAIISILAWMKMAFTGELDKRIYADTQAKLLICIWALMHLSDMLSPYQVYFAGVTSDIVLGSINTIVIMYFVGLGLLSNVKYYQKAFLYMSLMFGFICVYYVYWANDMYLSYRWDMFDINGRLNSPRGTSIGDQNALSGLIVMGMPFVLFGFFYLQKKWQKYACLLVIPFLWHALFLFGSRAALIAVFFTTIFILRLLKPVEVDGKAVGPEFKFQKGIKILVVVGFLGALIDQGGTMLSRSSATASAAGQESEEPLNPRLVSWSVGARLVLEYPLLGAGPQRFQIASQTLFPGESAHVAHNTFLNFSANTGLPVGLMFLLMFWLTYKNFRHCREMNVYKYPILDYVNNCCIAGLFAYFISAVFLDLIIFEAFYFLLMLNAAKYFIVQRLYDNEITEQENVSSGSTVVNTTIDVQEGYGKQ